MTKPFFQTSLIIASTDDPSEAIERLIEAADLRPPEIEIAGVWAGTDVWRLSFKDYSLDELYARLVPKLGYRPIVLVIEAEAPVTEVKEWWQTVRAGMKVRPVAPVDQT